MIRSLSTIIITKNAGDVLEDCLLSIKDLASEVIMVDDGSVDQTIKIAEKYGASIFSHHERDLGKQKAWALSKSTKPWVLSLDADERASETMAQEVKESLEEDNNKYSGYIIPFQNHFLGRSLLYGGENYKMMRLFRRDSVLIENALVHEGFRLRNGEVGSLKNPILHFSYRSLTQMYKKFTDYAIREAQQKRKCGEKSSLKKIFLYPLHMIWARFIKDKGYKDGLFRL
ncbi:MAG: glycosyltransferase family 2 protein, partial [Candidatus Roizmanbacteria bacterium]